MYGGATQASTTILKSRIFGLTSRLFEILGRITNFDILDYQWFARVIFAM